MDNQSTMGNVGLAAPQPSSIVFEEFPPELRVKIMKLVPEPRTVKLVWDKTNKIFKTTTRPPVNMSVNAEWRAEALKIYALAFGSDDSPSIIPIDFEIDTVYVPNLPLTIAANNMSGHPVLNYYMTGLTTCKFLSTTSNFSKIQYLQIDSTFVQEKVYPLVEKLPSLKKLFVLRKCGQNHQSPGTMESTDTNCLSSTNGSPLTLLIVKIFQVLLHRLKVRLSQKQLKQVVEARGRIRILDGINLRVNADMKAITMSTGAECAKCTGAVSKMDLSTPDPAYMKFSFNGVAINKEEEGNSVKDEGEEDAEDEDGEEDDQIEDGGEEQEGENDD